MADFILDHITNADKNWGHFWKGRGNLPFIIRSKNNPPEPIHNLTFP
jgi:hypothetical protein